MAVYEYECGTCGERFEVSVPMNEHERLKREPPACPKCAAKDSRRLISSFSCKPPSSW